MLFKVISESLFRLNSRLFSDARKHSSSPLPHHLSLIPSHPKPHLIQDEFCRMNKKWLYFYILNSSCVFCKQKKKGKLKKNNNINSKNKNYKIN